MSAAQYKALVDATREESEKAEEALATSSAQFRAELSRSKTGLDDVVQALPTDSALVSYVRYDRTRLAPGHGPSATPPSATPRAIPSYVALVVRAGQPPVAISLGSAHNIDTLAAQWRGDIAAEALSVTPDASGGTPDNAVASSTATAAGHRTRGTRLLSNDAIRSPPDASDETPGHLAGWPAPRCSVTIRSASKGPKASVPPSGHRTSMRSTVAAVPRPTCTRGSLAAR